jgi:hypothetical protein
VVVSIDIQGNNITRPVEAVSAMRGLPHCTALAIQTLQSAPSPGGARLGQAWLMHHFTYSDGAMRVSRHPGIGQGKLMTSGEVAAYVSCCGC